MHLFICCDCSQSVLLVSHYQWSSLINLCLNYCNRISLQALCLQIQGIDSSTGWVCHWMILPICCPSIDSNELWWLIVVGECHQFSSSALICHSHWSISHCNMSEHSQADVAGAGFINSDNWPIVGWIILSNICVTCWLLLIINIRGSFKKNPKFQFFLILMCVYYPNINSKISRSIFKKFFIFKI